MIPVRILVVDNDPPYRDTMIAAALDGADFQVTAVDNVEQASEALTRELFHLAIVDIRLINEDDPNDDSGLRFCRQMDPTIGRIVLTAFKDAGMVREALLMEGGREALADGFLFKDEDSAAVLSEVKRVIAEKFEVLPRKRIAVLTSGGDSPGMNAAIWSVVRTAMANEVEVLGVEDGYRGLVEGRIRKLTWNSITEVLAKGGTVLKTARFDDFRKVETRRQAAMNLIQRHVSGLVVIGGDGSMQGAVALAQDVAAAGGVLQTVALPGTIDNDLAGTDMSLGAASAANAIADELAKLIPPAQALRRVFVVEVMGRYSGFLALEAGLAAGADALLIPETLIQVHSTSKHALWRDRIAANETETRLRKQLETIADRLERSFSSGKRHALVIVSEGIRLLLSKSGDEFNAMEYIARYLKDAIESWSHDNKPDVRVQELGYPVRGANPCRFDMILGAELGAKAVSCLIEGKTQIMLGWSRDSGVVETSFTDVMALSNRPPGEVWSGRLRWQELLELHDILTCPPGKAEVLGSGSNRFMRRLPE